MEKLPLLVMALAVAGYSAHDASVSKQPIAPDGTEVQNDLPPNLHRQNISSRGQGCCVHTSIHHAALWQDVPALQEFAKWVQSKGISGGAGPGSVEQRINAICKDRGLPVPEYIQVEGGDLEILKLACKTGRIPGVTYGFSPSGRYDGHRISHMVTLLHADDRHFCVLDNNYPQTWEWLTPDEFRKAYVSGGGGWAVILLDSGPPPLPVN